MSLSGDVTTTLLIEGVTLALVIGLLAHTPQLVKRERISTKIFFNMCVMSMIIAVTGAATYLLMHRHFAGARALSIAVVTVHEILMALFLFHWLVLVDYLMFRSRDHLLRRGKGMLVCLVLIVILMIVNIFTGWFITFDEDNTYVVKPLYLAIALMEILYLLTPAVILLWAKMNKKQPNFIKILPFLSAFLAGSVATLCTPYAVRGLGIAVGMVLIHFSLMNLRCYMNEEFNCYNRAYVDYLVSFADDNNLESGTQILFETEGDEAKLAQILNDEKPDNSALIRLAPGRYIVIVGAQMKSAGRLLIANVNEVCEEEGLEVDTDISTRKKDESAETFMNRFL